MVFCNNIAFHRYMSILFVGRLSIVMESSNQSIRKVGIVYLFSLTFYFFQEWTRVLLPLTVLRFNLLYYATSKSFLMPCFRRITNRVLFELLFFIIHRLCLNCLLLCYTPVPVIIENLPLSTWFWMNFPFRIFPSFVLLQRYRTE